MNVLEAEITSLQSAGELSLIVLTYQGDSFTALIISGQEPYIFKGSKVKMVFKETELSLAKSFIGEISLRNRFVSTVKQVKQGKILTEVLLNYKNIEITSIITSSSAEAMEIKEGDTVTGMLKSNELMLMQND